jgi:hypothetical protein
MRYIYLQALRDEYFVPWVSGSRLADFRGFTLPVAKVALSNILTSFKDGKLAFFNLHIAVCDAPQIEEWSSHLVSILFLILFLLILLFMCEDPQFLFLRSDLFTHTAFYCGSISV